MKKNILFIILIVQAFCIYGQSPDAEKQALDSLFKSAKLNKDQVADLRKKWNAFMVSYTYPELTLNNSTGEIEFSDILTFGNLDKKAIFQRCLQFISINYGNLIYSDLESGKIIANGQIDLTHHAEYHSGFGSKLVHPVQTSTNYSMILTLKDNKVKYIITNITYNFTYFSETVSDTSMPINSLFPIVSKDQIQWVRFITVLNESRNRFYFLLKKSLADYINDMENDYKF